MASTRRTGTKLSTASTSDLYSKSYTAYANQWRHYYSTVFYDVITQSSTLTLSPFLNETTSATSLLDFNQTVTGVLLDDDNVTANSSIISYDSPNPLSTWQIVLIAILAGVISIVTTGGNLIVLLSFFIERSIRQPTNYFIGSLAVSDLIIGTISLPIYTLYLLANKQWLLGEIVCDLWLSIDYTVCLCSIYTVFCITIDRYCSVKIPAKYRNWRTERKVGVIIVITWTVPICVFFTTIFGWQYFVGERTVLSHECRVQYMENPFFNCFLQVGYFWITLIVMCVLYSGIYRVALNLQSKSEAKERKMTSLVSVAGHEIGKIGIGMSKCVSTGTQNQRKQKNSSKHQTNKTKPVESSDLAHQKQCTRHGGKKRRISSCTLPCTSSASFSSSRTPVVEEEQVFSSESSQSPEATSVPEASRKKRPPSFKGCKVKHANCDGKTTLKLQLPRLSNKKPKTQNRENIYNEVGHIPAESIDDLSGFDSRISYSHLHSECVTPDQVDIHDGVAQSSVKNYSESCNAINKQYRHCDSNLIPPKGCPRRLDKCHRSAEILYSCPESRLPKLGCSEIKYENPSYYINEAVRCDPKQSSSSEDVFQSDDHVMSRSTGNQNMLPNVNYSSKLREPCVAVVDGSEFLLKSHVDSGMMARFSLGNMRSGAQGIDYDCDTPTSPIWKPRFNRSCSGPFVDVPSTSTSYCSTGRVRDDTHSLKFFDNTHTQRPSSVFRFPSILNTNDKNNANIENNDKYENCLRQNSHGASQFTFGRSCSDYEACMLDTAMTDIPDEWRDHGPAFSNQLSTPSLPDQVSVGGRPVKSNGEDRKRSAKCNLKTSSTKKSKPGRKQRSGISLSTNGSRKCKVSTTGNEVTQEDHTITTSMGERTLSQQASAKSRRSENRARKALRTISIILGAFVLCWTPWHVLSLIISVDQHIWVLNLLYDISYYLCYLNSPINPFCYAFVNQQFKKTFLRILKCDWHRT